MEKSFLPGCCPPLRRSRPPLRRSRSPFRRSRSPRRRSRSSLRRSMSPRRRSRSPRRNPYVDTIGNRSISSCSVKNKLLEQYFQKKRKNYIIQWSNEDNFVKVVISQEDIAVVVLSGYKFSKPHVVLDLVADTTPIKNIILREDVIRKGFMLITVNNFRPSYETGLFTLVIKVLESESIPDLDTDTTLAHNFEKIGNVYSQRGDTELARVYYESALCHRDLVRKKAGPSSEDVSHRKARFFLKNKIDKLCQQKPWFYPQTFPGSSFVPLGVENDVERKISEIRKQNE